MCFASCIYLSEHGTELSSKNAFTRLNMLVGVSIAPIPVSPHINFFAIHSISMWPQLLSTWMCWPVIGCVHIRVFMAGQKNNGLSKSHARVVHSSKLSHIPPAILANVFASNGAMSITSAHLPKSMCNTGSSRFSHKLHSSASVSTVTSAGNWFRSKKCKAFLVQTTFIWNRFEAFTQMRKRHIELGTWSFYSLRIWNVWNCCKIRGSIHSIWWWPHCRCIQSASFLSPFSFQFAFYLCEIRVSIYS